MRLHKSKIKDILLFGSFSDIEMGDVDDLERETTQEFSGATEIDKVVIDLGLRYTITPGAIRKLSLFALELRKKGKLFYFLNADVDLRRLIRNKGLDKLFNLILDISEIKKDQPTRRSVDVNFLNPFIEGTINTLSIQCQLECKAMKPEVKTDTFNHPVDIAGVIGVTSEGFTGSISICFPETVFLKIMTNMLGEECSVINKEMEDGAGELLNIIFGHAKRVLNEQGYKLEKAIPTIVRGNQLQVKHITPFSTFILPFETAIGSFYLEISAET